MGLTINTWLSGIGFNECTPLYLPAYHSFLLQKTSWEPPPQFSVPVVCREVPLIPTTLSLTIMHICPPRPAPPCLRDTFRDEPWSWLPH